MAHGPARLVDACRDFYLDGRVAHKLLIHRDENIHEKLGNMGCRLAGIGVDIRMAHHVLDFGMGVWNNRHPGGPGLADAAGTGRARRF